jgi:hypothetical protein
MSLSIKVATTGEALVGPEGGAMSAARFEALARLLGPEDGPAHDSLRAYFVTSMTKAEAARSGGIARSTMTKYVAKWESKLALLAGVEWDAYLQRYRRER